MALDDARPGRVKLGFGAAQLRLGLAGKRLRAKPVAGGRRVAGEGDRHARGADRGADPGEALGIERSGGGGGLGEGRASATPRSMRAMSLSIRSIGTEAQPARRRAAARTAARVRFFMVFPFFGSVLQGS